MKYFPLEYNFYHNPNSEKYLIMLHGWGCEGKIFKEYIELLKNDYSIIVFDLYGFGQSIVPKLFFDTYEYAIQIYLFLQKRNIDNIDIIAHSFGGRIAVILSSVFDININKIVLTGSAGLKPRYSFKYYIKVLSYKFIKKLGIVSKNAGSLDYQNANLIMRRIFVKVVNQHLDYLLKNINSQVFLIWGKQDKSTPVYMLNKFNTQIKNSKQFVIDKASHFCVFSHSYLCKNKIREFLVLK